MGYRSPENPLATSALKKTLAIVLALTAMIALLLFDFARYGLISYGTLFVIAVLSALFVIWRNRVPTR